jgi:membrane protein required for colicin V production
MDHLIDLFFIFAFMGFLFLGFSHGMIRMTILIVTFYLSLVLATLYFEPLGAYLKVKFDSSRTFADFTGFTLILLLGYLLLASAGLYTFRYAKIPGQLQYVDRIVGTVLSIILAVLVLGILAVILTQIRWAGVDLPLAKWFQKTVNKSELIGLFKNYLLPHLYYYVAPILPNDKAIEKLFT